MAQDGAGGWRAVRPLTQWASGRARSFGGRCPQRAPCSWRSRCRTPRKNGLQPRARRAMPLPLAAAPARTAPSGHEICLFGAPFGRSSITSRYLLDFRTSCKACKCLPKPTGSLPLPSLLDGASPQLPAACSSDAGSRHDQVTAEGAACAPCNSLEFWQHGLGNRVGGLAGLHTFPTWLGSALDVWERAQCAGGKCPGAGGTHALAAPVATNVDG